MEGKIPTIYDRGVWSAAVKHLSKRDKVLAKLIKRLGRIKVNWGGDSYESLMSAIIYQQISGAAGDSIERRFKALYNNRMPSPKRFLATPGKKVRAAGISPQKYSYIVDLCTRIRDGRLELSKFDVMDDEDIIEELDEVKGIGRWTAEMFLMFSLKRVDIFPMDDLGIQNGIKEVYGMRRRPGREEMLELSERWRPYRSVAALYLWRSQDQQLPGQ